MNEEITFILVVEAIIAIAAIVAYFYLCFNVSQIKHRIAPKESNFTCRFNMLLALGQKEEAKKFLIETMIASCEESGGSIVQIEKVLKKYAAFMEEVGLTVDKKFLETAMQQ